MANFQVELPDGRKFKVEGVANPEAAYAAIEQMTAQQGGQQQPAAAQPQQPERYVDPDASRGMFAVDRAQTLAGNAIEGTGRFIEQSAPAVGGPMAEYGRSVVEKNEADIARRGYQSTYQGSFRDQEGVADTLGWTGEKMVENAIPTLATYGGYAAAALTAPYSVPIATLIAAGTTAATVGMGIGETTDELKSKVSEDDYNPNAAVIGGTIVGLLDRFGATKALGVSKAKLLTMSLDEITAALRKAGKGKIAKNIMRGMAVEGVTEAAQENVIMGTAATQGAEYTGDEVIDRNIDSAVLGAAMGGSMTATTETVGKATRLFKDDGSIEDIENLTREHQQSAATFARRIDKIATGGDLNGNTFDLQDIDKMSQTGARAVVEAAHTDLVGEIADKAGDLKELLRKSDQDTFDQRFKKVRAAVAQKMARNKTKSVVTAENFLALQDLVGGYTEGQALMNLIRESQIMTEVHNNDYQGKLSKFTDMFAIAGGGSGYDKSAVAVERVVRPIGSLAFGMNSYGLSLLGQQAVASIGKRLDKARGTYSSVDKFIKENKDKAGLPAPRPPSFRDQRLQQAQQASSTRAGLQAYNDQRDGGDNIKSPVGSILAGTGLSPAGLNKLLDYIETAQDTTPDVMVYVDQTRRNLAGEGNSIDDMSPWIQAINGTLNQSEELDALREDQPDNPLAQRARRRAGFGPSTAQSSAGTSQQPQGRSAAVQSGIDDNRAQLEKLRQGLAANTSLTPAERGRLLTALDTLEYNLGSDPAVAAMDVVSRLKSDGISESLINRHIMPYVERVLQQQARSGRRQQPPSTGNTGLAFDQDLAQQGNTGVLATPPAQQPQPNSPFNMKSLVNKMLGSQPATPDQVKAQLPFVRPAFEIGKAGTKYADGIQDIDAALQLSKALNVSVRLFDSQQEMFDDMGRPLTENARGIRGAYSDIGRTVWGMNAGAQAETLGDVNDLYALTTVLHELGHAVAKDSGFESVIERMMQDNSEYSDSVRKRVYKEIDNIQKNINLYVENNPKQRRPVRRIMAALQARKDDPTQTPRVNRFLDYINQADERAVDPVLLYFVNPRLAKAVAPTTSQLVKENLNASGNPDLKLHAYPFATMVAVVLAMILNGRAEEEEEEEQMRQQMPAGALSPPAGSLSPQQAA